MDNKNADGSPINSGGKPGTLKTPDPLTVIDHASAPVRVAIPAPPKPWIPLSHG